MNFDYDLYRRLDAFFWNLSYFKKYKNIKKGDIYFNCYGDAYLIYSFLWQGWFKYPLIEVYPFNTNYPAKFRFFGYKDYEYHVFSMPEPKFEQNQIVSTNNLRFKIDGVHPIFNLDNRKPEWEYDLYLMPKELHFIRCCERYLKLASNYNEYWAQLNE